MPHGVRFWCLFKVLPSCSWLLCSGNFVLSLNIISGPHQFSLCDTYTIYAFEKENFTLGFYWFVSRSEILFALVWWLWKGFVFEWANVGECYSCFTKAFKTQQVGTCSSWQWKFWMFRAILELYLHVMCIGCSKITTIHMVYLCHCCSCSLLTV